MPDKMMDRMVWLVDFIRGLNKIGWYGKLTLSFEAGKITLVRKEETFKPPKQ